nr:N-6 DNA methylase [Desulfobacula sp.]
MTSNNSQNSFNALLEKFEMISEGYKSPSLLLPDDLHLPDGDKIILEQAGKYNVDAVYIRRFNDGRTPIPQIYIYDFINNSGKDNEITELYRKIWNSGHVPLIFLFFKTEIQILTCLKQPDFDRKTGSLSYSLFEKIHLASNAKKELEKFRQLSARRFDNGSFWTDSKYKNKFSLKETAFIKLLTELKTAKREITKKKILNENLTKKLLVMSILVKYLEEREDKDGNKVFPKRFFIKFSNGEDNFLDVLRKKGGCLRLFDELSSENSLNGEIFAWNGKTEREQLAEADLNSFADFFEGRLDNGQYTFWRLYSFNDLPIELISNIYEEFLDKKAGVVYTPPYLVNLLVDELLPLSDFEKKEFKVLDPACGSGIFLVAAYKRMIQWWKIRNNWAKPGSQNLGELKEILKNNIFGVDIHEEAIRLTFFSLSLVLLDELSPKVIWENLKFDNLIGNNLISSDFLNSLRKGY